MFSKMILVMMNFKDFEQKEINYYIRYYIYCIFGKMLKIVKGNMDYLLMKFLVCMCVFNKYELSLLYIISI